MKLTIQRARNCVVTVNGEVVCQIASGILCYVGFYKNDKDGDADWIARKALSMFYWPAEDDTPWKRGVIDMGGDVVVVCEPGLIASVDFTDKPSYENVMEADPTKEMFTKLIQKMQKIYPGDKIHGIPIDGRKTIDFINDGPLTLSIDSYRRRE